MQTSWERRGTFPPNKFRILFLHKKSSYVEHKIYGAGLVEALPSLWLTDESVMGNTRYAIMRVWGSSELVSDLNRNNMECRGAYNA